MNTTNEWEKDILLTARKSDKTKSGLEVVYDPYSLIDTISQLLQQREKALAEKIKKLEKPIEIDVPDTLHKNVGFNQAIKAVISLLENK